MHINPIFDFLTALAQNNHKAWFDENRKTYEQAKKLFEGEITTLLEGLQGFDEGLWGLEPKKCMFRINRDVRFSKDKSPYKLNFGGFFQKGGKKVAGAGYYLHIQPAGESFVAGGIYAPQPPELAKIRQEIDYNFAEFSGIVTAESFKNAFGTLQGEKVKGTPKGYQADNPALAYLQHKSLVVWRKLPDSFFSQDDWTKQVLPYFQAMKPLQDFLNRAIQ